MALGQSKHRPAVETPDQFGVIDVSEFSFETVREYVRQTDDVYFERRGSTTYLIAK